MSFYFRDRRQAGELLAEKLKPLSSRNPVVIALPRGGVTLGASIARALHAPLDLLVVRKIGAPSNPEYGIGAVSEGGAVWINEEIVEQYRFGREDIDETVAREKAEVSRRVRSFRGDRPLVSVKNRWVILVDDGLATGVTASVAVRDLKNRGAAKVILAAPVGAGETIDWLRQFADEVIVLARPDRFMSVGQWYQDFRQVTEEEVIAMLHEAENTGSSDIQMDIQIGADGIELPGTISLPDQCKGLVIFAHGSGSSRHSPRNQAVSESLNNSGLGTLLFDLLTPEEGEDRSKVFDIPLLAARLTLAARWARATYPDVPIGYFGASTGAGAALWSAAELGDEISAVVSRGGRPDLAIPRLEDVTAPVLLIVGGKDGPVIEMNHEALAYIDSGKLVIVPCATHLFEEPGTLDEVSRLASDWFLNRFPSDVKKAA